MPKNITQLDFLIKVFGRGCKNASNRTAEKGQTCCCTVHNKPASDGVLNRSDVRDNRKKQPSPQKETRKYNSKRDKRSN